MRTARAVGADTAEGRVGAPYPRLRHSGPDLRVYALSDVGMSSVPPSAGQARAYVASSVMSERL